MQLESWWTATNSWSYWSMSDTGNIFSYPLLLEQGSECLTAFRYLSTHCLHIRSETLVVICLQLSVSFTTLGIMAVETTTNINSADTEKISISLRDVFSYWHDYWDDTNVCAFKVNKAVYHSGHRDKHNCPWWDSILRSDTLQSGMLPIDICVLSLVLHPRDAAEPKCRATSSSFILWSHCMKSFCSTLQNTKTLHRGTHVLQLGFFQWLVKMWHAVW